MVVGVVIKAEKAVIHDMLSNHKAWVKSESGSGSSAIPHTEVDSYCHSGSLNRVSRDWSASVRIRLVRVSGQTKFQNEQEESEGNEEADSLVIICTNLLSSFNSLSC